MSPAEKLKIRIYEELDKLKNWEKLVDEKKILWENTPEEIKELRKDIFMEMIAPLIFEYQQINK